MDKIFGANSANLESWPPSNSTNFDVKPELPQGATQVGQALAGLNGHELDDVVDDCCGGAGSGSQ